MVFHQSCISQAICILIYTTLICLFLVIHYKSKVGIHLPIVWFTFFYFFTRDAAVPFFRLCICFLMYHKSLSCVSIIPHCQWSIVAEIDSGNKVIAVLVYCKWAGTCTAVNWLHIALYWMNSSTYCRSLINRFLEYVHLRKNLIILVWDWCQY